jgi:hypothetical protein
MEKGATWPMAHVWRDWFFQVLQDERKRGEKERILIIQCRAKFQDVLAGRGTGIVANAK